MLACHSLMSAEFSLGNFHCEVLCILFKCLLTNEKYCLWPGSNEINLMQCLLTFCISYLLFRLQLQLLYYLHLGRLLPIQSCFGMVMQDPVPHTRLGEAQRSEWQRFWSKYNTHHVSSTELSFSALKRDCCCKYHITSLLTYTSQDTGQAWIWTLEL